MSAYVLAALPGMAFDGPEGARSYVEWLYTTGVRDWRLDARRFLGSIDGEFALASDAALEDEFFKFEWIDQIRGVTAASPSKSSIPQAVGIGEGALQGLPEPTRQSNASDGESGTVRDRIVRDFVF